MINMATSSIKKNFIIEGQDAEDFANSLDEVIAERDEKRKQISKIKYIEITDKDEIKKYLKRIAK